MKVEVEIVSKEMIKPSSPTPHHLSSYQLSFLDQISPPVYNPVVMFYYPQRDTEFNVVEISNKLKKSMSHVLTLFYPLAGRLNESTTFIDCNDKGIPYFEAKVNCQLSDFLQNPILPNELNKFIPFESDKVSDLELGVQLNIFECGAIAIGSCISHKIADGLSSFMFLKSWAAIARGEHWSDHMQVRPRFEAATLFPPKNLSGFNPRTGITNKNNIVSKRFLFNASTIEDLRQRYAVNNKGSSRVEALSAFIWDRFVAATTQVGSKEAEDDQRLYIMVQAVNLRTRIEPPLSEYSFGNLYRFVKINVPSNDRSPSEENCGIVKEMRDQICHIDDKYVKKLQEGTEHLDFMKKRAEEFFKRESTLLNFSSWCRFPLYESDFGWGKPVWVGLPPLTFKNLVVFMDTRSGDGIEAYINLDQNDMAKLESDDEFLAFVSPKGF